MTENGENSAEKKGAGVPVPPRGLMLLSLVGPGLVWAGEYIGSGEVILCTRIGAIMGTAILWLPFIAIFLKYWIGIAGARYTVCTGEGMIDMFSRMPGPRNWAVWIVLVGQFSAGAVSMAALSLAAAAFLNSLTGVNQVAAGWTITLIIVCIVWSGKFAYVRYIVSMFILVMIIGVIYVVVRVFPGFGEIFFGLFGFSLPEIPAWAIDSGAATANVWEEALPVLGWAAGGFASQVWYSYWVLESGYGMAAGRDFGQKADENLLRSMSTGLARRVKGWCRVVYTDGTTALVVGTVVTTCFVIAGHGVLGKAELAPSGAKVAIELSNIFSSFWGKTGAVLFLLAGTAAMISTNLCQFAGWPRIMADCLRLIFPRSLCEKQPRKIYRSFILVFMVTNMVIINTFGIKPVMLIKVGALLDGIILCPMQAILVAAALYSVMPKMLSREAWAVLRPNPVFLVFLLIAAGVFGYFGLIKIPTLF